MSINKLVPIRDAVFNACEDMGIKLTNQIPTLTRWASDAERKIGSYYGWKRKFAVLDIENCTAKLPCGAMQVQYLLIGDHGCDCNDLMTSLSSWMSTFRPAMGETFLVVDVAGNGFNCSGTRWEIQDNKIVFASNMDGQKATIQYLGYEEDKDGFITVNENHVNAIVYYIKYMFAERSRFSPIKMDLADVDRLEVKWRNARGEALADDSILTDAERQEIVAMLHDPYVGWGLSIGMH